MYYAVILAGGVGSRLWPRSRQSNPKQFSDITGSGRTMIQETVDRLAGLVPDENIHIVTGDRYSELAAAQLPQLPRENILVEPYGRNTGPAIGLACAYLHARDPQAVVAFLHADQAIPQVGAFQTTLKRAIEAAEADHLVTLGITPTHPNTGFGYIRRASELTSIADNELPVYEVDKFLEKPDRETAKAFLAEGTYYWNGGMFICSVARMMQEFERQLPDSHALIAEMAQGYASQGADFDISAIWDKMPEISIDHGIMENAEQVAVVPLDAGWNDVGSWNAIEAIRELDENNNCIAQGEVIALESSGSIVYSEKIVALIGIEDLVIVETDDAILVGRKDQMQQVKSIVELLKSQGRTDLL